MDIRELILDAEILLEKIDSGIYKIRLGFICKSINLTLRDLFEFLESENIVIENNINATISSDLFKQLLLKEPETLPLGICNLVLIR